MKPIVAVCLAIAFALAALAADPDAESLMRNGHWKRAREVAEALYHAHPNDAYAAWLLARVRRAFGDAAGEMQYAAMAVHLDPKGSAYHRELGLAYLQQVEHSSMLKAIGTMRNCRAELDAALAIAPRDPDNLFEKMDFLLQAPGLAGGDKKKALAAANELVQVDPARGYLALARVAWKQREFGRLEELHRKAVEANPHSYDALVALAGLYLGRPVVPEDSNSRSRTNFKLAEQHARAALEVNPDRIEAYRILAVSLVSQRRFEETEKLLALSGRAIPDDLSPYVWAARTMRRDGVELARAETYLQKYLAQTREPEVGAPSLNDYRLKAGRLGWRLKAA
ncbi:putative Tetratricopeptide repeat protein [Candidatus Sulfopaludibacter sp. SbA3]|nr:putative Tetratricopeptide repeat protein [Candidatus Sulfopaludibacter sp. SbA3]